MINLDKQANISTPTCNFKWHDHGEGSLPSAEMVAARGGNTWPSRGTMLGVAPRPFRTVMNCTPKRKSWAGHNLLVLKTQHVFHSDTATGNRGSNLVLSVTTLRMLMQEPPGAVDVDTQYQLLSW